MTSKPEFVNIEALDVFLEYVKFKHMGKAKDR